MIKTRYIFLDSPISLDLEQLKRKLATLAQQGWVITKVGSTVLTLKLGEPQDLQYEIDFLPQADAFMSDDDPIIKNYKLLCEQSGWHYIGRNHHLFIFSAHPSQPFIALQTDVTVQNDTLTSVTIKHYLLPLFIPFFSLFLIQDLMTSTPTPPIRATYL